MGKENDRKRKKKKGGFGVVRTVILIVAICVFCYSGYRLYSILSVYQRADSEYNGLAEDYTTPYNPDITPVPSVDANPIEDGEDTDDNLIIEDAEPPLSVDWDELKAINSDIVGWLYVDAESNISYPICLGEDNDFYLHRTFRKEYLFAGAIFEDFHNSSDFADPDTIVYGHNMKSGSMFGMLKFIDDQETYDANPFFWILTPYGNYRYHIFSIYKPEVNSDVYTLFGQNGEEFLKWEEKQQELSDVKNEVPLSANDKTVILSTCTSDSSRRCVVIGKCVSSDRPVRRSDARRYKEPVITSAAENALPSEE